MLLTNLKMITKFPLHKQICKKKIETRQIKVFQIQATMKKKTTTLTKPLQVHLLQYKTHNYTQNKLVVLSKDSYHKIKRIIKHINIKNNKILLNHFRVKLKRKNNKVKGWWNKKIRKLRWLNWTWRIIKRNYRKHYNI